MLGDVVQHGNVENLVGSDVLERALDQRRMRIAAQHVARLEAQ